MNTLAAASLTQKGVILSVLMVQIFLFVFQVFITVTNRIDPAPKPQASENASFSDEDYSMECVVDNITVQATNNSSQSKEALGPKDILRDITPSFVTTERHHWSCTFARINEYEVLTTPGGDMGEYLTALAAYISLSENTTDFSVERIRVLWYSYLEDACVQKKKLFYMHTNATAVQLLGDYLGITTTWSIVDPPSAYRTQLLELVVEPQYIGCHHLRMMVEHPTQYGVPRGLFNTLMRLYYSTLWGLEPGSEEYRYNLRLEVTPTNVKHEHIAVVNIYHTGCSGMTPVTSVEIPNVYSFLPNAINDYRKNVVSFFHNVADDGGGVSLLGNSDLNSSNIVPSYKSLQSKILALFSSQASLYDKVMLGNLSKFDIIVRSHVVVDANAASPLGK